VNARQEDENSELSQSRSFSLSSSSKAHGLRAPLSRRITGDMGNKSGSRRSDILDRASNFSQWRLTVKQMSINRLLANDHLSGLAKMQVQSSCIAFRVGRRWSPLPAIAGSNISLKTKHNCLQLARPAAERLGRTPQLE
jgi:hypothetical protein